MCPSLGVLGIWGRGDADFEPWVVSKAVSSLEFEGSGSQCSEGTLAPGRAHFWNADGSNEAKSHQEVCKLKLGTLGASGFGDLLRQ